MGRTIQDPVLGPLVRNGPLRRWEFVIQAGRGPVDGHILTDSADPAWDPLSPGPLARTRVSALWIAANEPVLRARVAAAMFDEWWHDYGDPGADGPTERADFAAALRLGEAAYAEDGLAYLAYFNEHPAGGDPIWVAIDPAGTIVIGPSVPW